MAVYYINPHVTFNGTGTWASPWSFSSATRTVFNSGDELRIISVPTTSLWTATVYTATVTSNYQLTVTAGGGLGADFAANNIVYIVEADAYIRVSSVATNVLSLPSSTGTMLPMNSTANTTVTLRRVDVTTYPAGTNSSAAYLYGNADASNVTVTDGWTADGVRVTDGSAHTVIYGSATGSVRLYDFSGQTYYGAGNTINMAQSYVLYGLSSTTSQAGLTLFGDGQTCTFGQFFSATSAGTLFSSGGSTEHSSGNTITIRRLDNVALLGTIYSSNVTFNITYMTNYYLNWALTGSNSSAVGRFLSNFTLNVTNLIGYTTGTSTTGIFMMPPYGMGGPVNINFTGVADMWTSATMSAVSTGLTKDATITLGAGVTLYYTRRTGTTTSLTYPNNTTGSYNVAPVVGTPAVVNNSTLTIGATESVSSWYSNTLSYNMMGPTTYPVVMYVSNTASVIYGLYLNNLLVVPRDGTDPREICSPNGGYTGSFPAAAASNFAVVATDATVYRTTGPSLRAFLNTRTGAIWGQNTSSKAWASKSIKVPCTAGVAKTVAGYFRYNFTVGTFVNGDAKLKIVLFGNTIVSQSMTTAANNSWEAFSLTFTPAITGEYDLVWEFTFAGGLNYMYIDDLTIS